MKQIIIRSDGKWTWLKCNHCPKEFQLEKLRVSEGGGMFCSVKCYKDSGSWGGGTRKKYTRGHTADEIAFYDKYGWFTKNENAIRQFIEDRDRKAQMVTLII